MREFNGVLELSDDYDYIIDFQNLSAYLRSIWMSNVSNWMQIKVEDNYGQLINIIGDLYLMKNKHGIYDWCVDDYDLGTFLFNHTGEDLLIHIKTMRMES